MKKIFLTLCLLSSISFAREVIVTPSLSSNYRFGYEERNYPNKHKQFYNHVSIEIDLDVKTPVYKKEKLSVLVGGNIHEGAMLITKKDFFTLPFGPTIGVGPAVELKYAINKDLSLFTNASFDLEWVGLFVDREVHYYRDLSISPIIKLGVDYKNWIMDIRAGVNPKFDAKLRTYQNTSGNIGFNIGYNFSLNSEVK